VVTATLQQEAHARYRRLTDQTAEQAAALDRTRERADVARREADTVRAHLEQLDVAADAARSAERTALDALDGGPDDGATRGLLAALDRRDDLAARIGGLDRSAAEAERARADAEAAVADTAAAEAAHRARVEAAQLLAGAAGLAAALHVGEPCPVCRQTVHEIPSGHDHRELDALRAALRSASEATTAARAALDGARRDEAAASAEARAARGVLDELAATLHDAPDRSTLLAALDEFQRLRAAAKAARAAASAAITALEAARRDPTVAAAIDVADAAARALTEGAAALAEQRRQLATAADAVRGLPDEAAVVAAIAEATRLAKVRAQADEEFGRADADLADARRRLEAVDARTAVARAALGRARDGLAALGPPVLDTADVVAAWAALVAWIDAATQRTRTERDTAEAARGKLTRERQGAERGAADAAAEVLAQVTGSVDELHEALVRARADAAVAVATFDAERQRLEGLRSRITGLRAASAVADALGRLLSATGFEAWLMSAALEDLCARATTRLRMLSGGQFSLVVDDREFLVRDHHNADELRNVRTLSGGETFLASLALALALAEATAELAPTGAPTIESIFLDEGFGTLDPDTLEAVAGAIEELGASGRMVVVVTHIRELADRMPVRLEVTKTATGSSVRRVEL
jgi:exonuclease SbcC